MEHPENLNLLENLKPETLKAVNELAQKVSLPANKIIFSQGAAASNLYIMISGNVKIVRDTEEGKETILCMPKTGACFCPLPLMDKGSQLGMAKTITDTVLLVIKNKD